MAHGRRARGRRLHRSRLVDSGLDLVSDLWFFWIATGQTSEARRWLERGLGLGDRPSPSRTRAMVMCAYLCVQQEDLVAAAPLIDRASASADRHKSPHNQAWSTLVRAMAAMCEGDLSAAEPLFDEALQAHRSNADVVGIVDTLFFQAALSTLRGDFVRAEALYREAIIICESRGENWTKGYLLWGLGIVAWQEGATERATAHARAALRIGRQLNEQWAIAFSLELLAWAATTAGEFQRAAHLIGGARELWRRVGWRHAGVPLYYGMRELTDHHDECVSQLRAKLGAEFEHGMRQGATAVLDDLIVEALGERRGRPKERTSSRDGELPSLTKREREVAGLVHQGLTNREIAEKLVISPRTAEVHVVNILTKLGFKSRAQVAAWVAERRAHENW